MYSDWLEAFSPAMFHIGQDEVLHIVTLRFATIVISDTALKMRIERLNVFVADSLWLLELN